MPSRTFCHRQTNLQSETLRYTKEGNWILRNRQVSLTAKIFYIVTQPRVVNNIFKPEIEILLLDYFSFTDGNLRRNFGKFSQKSREKSFSFKNTCQFLFYVKMHHTFDTCVFTKRIEKQRTFSFRHYLQFTKKNWIDWLLILHSKILISHHEYTKQRKCCVTTITTSQHQCAPPATSAHSQAIALCFAVLIPLVHTRMVFQPPKKWLLQSLRNHCLVKIQEKSQFLKHRRFFGTNGLFLEPQTPI